jgi:hypothetical protein
MRIRFFALAAVLVLTLACNQGPGTGQQGAQGQQGAPTTNQTDPGATVPGTGTGGASTGQARGTTVATSAATTLGDQARPAPSMSMMMEMTVPTGTAIELALDTAVSSDKSQGEDTVRAHVTKPVVVDGMTVIPAGAQAVGTVVEAKPSGRVKGRASVTLNFNRITVANTPYTIHTARVMREAAESKGEDSAKKIGIGAGAGAVIGAIAGGKKGAAIGAGVGAGAGTGVVLATAGKEISLGVGSTVRTTIQDPVKINAPM